MIYSYAEYEYCTKISYANDVTKKCTSSDKDFLKWSYSSPKEVGFYWYRDIGEVDCQIAKIIRSIDIDGKATYYAFFPHISEDIFPVDILDGTWSGPISSKAI